MSPFLWAVLILLGAVVMASAARYIPSPEGYLSRVRIISDAIARAEGWFVEGSLCQRRNNPGALRLYGEKNDITQFATPADGWNALYRQVESMLSGVSAYYKPSMSIRTVANIYTGGDNAEAWAAIVAGSLGVSPNDPIGSVRVA